MQKYIKLLLLNLIFCSNIFSLDTDDSITTEKLHGLSLSNIDINQLTDSDKKSLIVYLESHKKSYEYCYKVHDGSSDIKEIKQKI